MFSILRPDNKEVGEHLFRVPFGPVKETGALFSNVTHRVLKPINCNVVFA